mmetsp:Transcript_5647/g.8675  ORF Transcript_5647/g.8675 Transcript_5647/m.8675 type:complete len:196 (+) Transcript_5647:485-1072(+)
MGLKGSKSDGKIASDFVSFVDDFCPSGPSSKEAWQASRRVASILNFLGLQDAPRKRRDSSQSPGAWIGGVVSTVNDSVMVTISEKKWNKTLLLINEVLTMIRKDKENLSRKRLEQIRGFLGYVTRTFPCSVPYLTGMHLTIDGWRQDRNPSGWRRKRPQKPTRTASQCKRNMNCEGKSDGWWHPEDDWKTNEDKN